MTSFGYAGTLLDVDLTAGTVTPLPLDPALTRDYLGGLGLGLKLLYDATGPGIDPFSSANILVFATGPFTGTAAPTASRTQVVTKSPLTGGIGTGNFGGAWGSTLKRAGVDAVRVRGASATPVYLAIADGRAELRDAAGLWGQDSWETTALLQQALGAATSVVAIGPAGERRVRFACPIADCHHAAGRSHAGGVMGAKQLKALAVTAGPREMPVADPAAFAATVRAIQARIAAVPESRLRTRSGSNYLNQVAAARGVLPGRNFQTGV
ncbi:MAG: aldehyde ferredoxin oxidoreductase N-terminal domain-containing protein, partial [Candidatus Methylomirabilota bacterium]